MTRERDRPSASDVQRRIHPGSGRRGQPRVKGRQVDDGAVAEVRDLIGTGPYRRDMLIEYLHLLHDRHHHLSARHMTALAHLMRLPLAEVYEVASFYAHFDLVMDGETPPPPLTIRVCDSLTCALMGAEGLLAELPATVGPDIRVVRAPCMGRCDQAPVCEVGHNHVTAATVTAVAGVAASGAVHPMIPPYPGLAAYRDGGGYSLLQRCLDGALSADAVIAVLEQSGLRGLGGAGFPTGRKWRFVRQEAAPRLMAINADEGEPGTFKDRYYLEADPHRFLEGTLIGAWVVEAADVYIYLRDEYPGLLQVLKTEIEALEVAGLTGGIRLHMRRGAGAYICGEESAMLESIEGKRGYPRHKPPFPSQVGLFGRPTLINNVESVFWVREILEKGGAWFAGQGRSGRKGLRSFSVSGRVRDPGVKLAPAGVTIHHLIDEFCGGMAEGHRFKAYLPGGASGGILPATLGDIPLDFDTLQAHGCFIGSAAVVVLSDQDDMRAVALNLMKFFEDESCGQCTPCRVGTQKAVRLMDRPQWDVPLLEELSRTMMDASICGLGQAAPNPLLSVIRHFPEDLR